jgi:small-conductance mechanosensitive channel
MHRFRLSAALTLLLALLLAAPAAAQSPEADFSGEWQTFWRTGSAVLTLEQEGDGVTGIFQPDDGSIEGTVEGRVLRGTWEQPGASGRVVFALSEDGQTLTGRFGNGEYWNGFRAAADSESTGWQLGNASPRETLRSLLIATNVATYQGDAGALRRVPRLVTYAGPGTTARDEASRRALMFELLDMSTIRLNDVPLAPEDPEAETVRFAVGPAAVPERVTLEFARDAFGRWRLVLPEAERLAAERDRLLAALGHDSKADLDRARADSPRAAMRDFVLGTHDWDGSGRDRALAVMDLSHIPERLHALEGPIYADYLKRILDRIAYIVWQEIPDDPDRSVPYVYFQHPVGNIALARVAEPPAEEGAAPMARWKFTTETVESAPALLEAMQDLPAIPGLEEPQALSPYFRLRESVRAAAPGLVQDAGYLERWQWLGLAATLAAAYAAFLVVGGALRGLARSEHRDGIARLAAPAGLVGAAAILSWAITRLGLTQVGLPAVGTLIGVFLILSIATLVYRIAGLVGGWFLTRAQKTTSHVDEIAASLGTGLVKLLVVVGAIIAVADVVGLPYEGVLAGLGVGGVAIAFAARDTVSNMLGGGILMADRPFQRGDLIELDGTLATVEHVGLRCTRLRSLDDTLLNVPNSHLSDRAIANWGKRRRRKVVLAVGLTLDTPREKLDRFVSRLREVMRDQPRVDHDDLYVGLKSFGASSIDIELMFYLKVQDYGAQVDAQHAIVMEIIALAEEVGVEFAFPTRTVHVQPPAAQGPETAGPGPAAHPRQMAPAGTPSA